MAFSVHLYFNYGIKRISKMSAILVLGVSLLLSLNSHAVLANNHPTDENVANNMAASASISNAWARATFSLAKTGAAYFVVSNIGSTAIVITHVSVSPKTANIAELHHTVMQSDMMQMQELTQGLKIKPGEMLEFLPGGKHIMLMGLSGPLINGETLVIELHFQDGSNIAQTFSILDKRL